MTELLYLQDTYLYESSAKTLEIGTDEFGNYIILDRTVFYPQGGGQPSDTGTITSGDEVFHVTQCKLSSEGIVHHYGAGALCVGDSVVLDIDKEKRILNARNHSAGHLLDIAVTQLGYNALIPTKGYHFSEGAYVEYQGEFTEDKEVFIEKVNTKMQELVGQDIPIQVEYQGFENIKAPTGKAPRYVSFEGYKGCGCGGTHIKNSGEILGVSLRKVKYKKGVLRVSYEIE